MGVGYAVETYKGIEIKYGYNAVDGMSIAHFHLPEKPINLSNVMKTTNASSMQSVVQMGQRKLVGELQVELLEQARKEIDRYFGE